MSNTSADQAALIVGLGLEMSRDPNGNLILHGPSRDVVVRQVTSYQVDDIRFCDPDEAIYAAISLFAD